MIGRSLTGGNATFGKDSLASAKWGSERLSSTAHPLSLIDDRVKTRNSGISPASPVAAFGRIICLVRPTSRGARIAGWRTGSNRGFLGEDALTRFLRTGMEGLLDHIDAFGGEVASKPV